MTFYFLYQVSFVFTNQVGGKLTPIESTVRQKTQEVEHNSLPGLKRGISYKNKGTSPVFSFTRDSRSSFNLKTLPSPHPKLMRTLEGKSKTLLSPRTSTSFQIPSNRLSPVCINDDDFV